MEVVFTLGKSNVVPEAPAFYDPIGKKIYVFLSVIRDRCGDEDDIIKYVVSSIIHESLHHAFRECLGPADLERIKKEHWVMRVIGLEDVPDV